MNAHRYETTLRWTGNLGSGTSGYGAYSRNHEIDAARKTSPIDGSSDPHFRGDATRYNPEELLVASLASCHMLSYLHLCAVNDVVVTAYEDNSTGTMELAQDGSGRLTEVVLHPSITITAGSDAKKAHDLHADAHRLCFIANSVNFPVRHEASIRQG